MTYKYGGSDLCCRLGAMQLLIWMAIREAKDEGFHEFDMGRTEWSNTGLLTFKDRWGAERSTLMYPRRPSPEPQHDSDTIPVRVAKDVVSVAPDRLLIVAGGVLYRHMA